jgi:hypothetical protein
MALDSSLLSPVWRHAARATGPRAVAVDAAPFGGEDSRAAVVRENEKVVSGGGAVAVGCGDVGVAVCGGSAFRPGEDRDCRGVRVAGVIYCCRNLVILDLELLFHWLSWNVYFSGS